MDLSKLRTITNNHEDVRLVSLKKWKGAAEISPRDSGGPYAITQEGYDPDDMSATPNEFVLGHSGKWLPVAAFYKLPVAERREEFLFKSAAEVIQLMESLPPKASVWSAKDKATLDETESTQDDLNKVFKEAAEKPPESPKT